jgi:AcrR family transcriptional regulator
MDQTVHLVVAGSQARQRLLDAAVEQALGTGIGDMSLRELASAIGTSHRMLLYHFGSREGLFTAVARAVEENERRALLHDGPLPGDAWKAWKRLSDPALWPQERLFFELYARALYERPGTEEFLDGIVDSWVEPVATALQATGADRRRARTDARLGLAVTRGLLLDLLATGDRRAVDAAFRRFLELLDQA